MCSEECQTCRVYQSENSEESQVCRVYQTEDGEETARRARDIDRVPVKESQTCRVYQREDSEENLTYRACAARRARHIEYTREKTARRARHVERVPVKAAVDLWYLCYVLLIDTKHLFELKHTKT